MADSIERMDEHTLALIRNRLSKERDAMNRFIQESMSPDEAKDELEISEEMFGMAFGLAYEMTTDTPKKALLRLPSALRNILMCIPLSPITDNPEEWADLPDELDEFLKVHGEMLWFTDDKLPGTGIKVESVQANLRYPMLRMFNHDPRTCHRIDGLAFYDDETNEQISPEEFRYSTLRFIELPWVWEPPLSVYINRETGKINYERGSNFQAHSTALPKFVQECIDAEALKNGAIAEGESAVTDEDNLLIINPEDIKEADETEEDDDDDENSEYKEMANGVLNAVFSGIFDGLPPVDEEEENDIDDEDAEEEEEPELEDDDTDLLTLFPKKK